MVKYRWITIIWKARMYRLNVRVWRRWERVGEVGEGGRGWERGWERVVGEGGRREW